MNKILLPIITLLFITSSCISFHHGNISSGPLLEPEYSLKGTAVGYAKTYRVLLFGGTKSTLIATAKENLYKTTRLKEGEYLSNFSVDFKETLYLFVHVTEVFVTADILSEKKGNKTFAENPVSEDVIVVGDSVYFGNWKIRGKVIEIEELKNPHSIYKYKAKVLYRDKDGKIKTRRTRAIRKKHPWQ